MLHVYAKEAMQFWWRIRPEVCEKTNDEGAQIIQAEGKTKAEQRKKATVEKAEAKQDEKKAKTEHEEAS